MRCILLALLGEMRGVVQDVGLLGGGPVWQAIGLLERADCELTDALWELAEVNPALLTRQSMLQAKG